VLLLTLHPIFLIATVTDDNREKTLNILRDFSTQLPRAAAPRRLALDVSIGSMNFSRILILLICAQATIFRPLQKIT
jgi:hypothetical protein